MRQCPSCGKRALPFVDWLLYSCAKCDACHRVAEKPRFVTKIVVGVARLSAISVVVLIFVYPRLITPKYLIVVGVLGVVALLLVPYFSRPMPYAGEFPVGPSRSERLLAPVLLVLVTALLVYAVYWLIATA